MELTLNPNSVSDYRTFLRIKQLPIYYDAARRNLVKACKQWDASEQMPLFDEHQAMAVT